jgi:hypothetical protein
VVVDERVSSLVQGANIASVVFMTELLFIFLISNAAIQPMKMVMEVESLPLYSF